MHQGLSNLVMELGSVRIKPIKAKRIVDASIEPDFFNKQEIESNILNSPKVYYNWWVNHTFRAGTLAISYIQEAKKAYWNRQSIWSQFLGWAFHFITDRATPYHSPVKLNRFINSIMDYFEVGTKRLNGFSIRDQIWIMILNVGANLFDKAIDLKKNHDVFELQCEQKWIPCKNLTYEIFLNLKKPVKSMINLSLIEKRLESLHQKYINISLEWINLCNNYAIYMAEIATIMDLACQFVLKK